MVSIVRLCGIDAHKTSVISGIKSETLWSSSWAFNHLTIDPLKGVFKTLNKRLLLLLNVFFLVLLELL